MEALMKIGVGLLLLLVGSCGVVKVLVDGGLCFNIKIFMDYMKVLVPFFVACFGIFVLLSNSLFTALILCVPILTISIIPIFMSIETRGDE